MTQITVVLALSAPLWRSKLRSEIMLDPDLNLVGVAMDPREAISLTRLHQPQAVLCDRGMLADSQMIAISQQARVVSALILVAFSDDKSATRVPVPVAGMIPVNRRPGELAGLLRAIIDAPAASFVDLPSASIVDPPPARGTLLRSASGRLLNQPFDYDPDDMPTLPPSGRLLFSHDQEQPKGNGNSSDSFLKSPHDFLDKGFGRDQS
jgi:hypothetical protein